MGLFSKIEQRKLDRTPGSESSWIPLKTPSGPQFTEAEMETELVEQLAFSPWVADILTQPIIRFMSQDRQRHYTGDVLFEVAPGHAGLWRYYLVEVKPRRYLEDFRTEGAERIAAAKAWCETQGAAFRIMSEKDIRTPLLRNTRVLSKSRNAAPDPYVLKILRDAAGTSGTSLRALIQACKATGIGEPEARTAIERAVAGRLVACNLSAEFNEDTLIFDDEAGAGLDTRDPILRLVEVADSA